jgi:NADPH2:quinone reductase
MGQSAYAEYTAVPSTYVANIPDSIDFKTAAATPLQGLTALTLIREAHAVQKGDWILVTAAAGGVGLWLCQLLKAVGARVIATASTEEKRQLAKENGAEVLLEYYDDDKDKFVKKVLEITGGEGVAAVFDSVGKSTFDSSLAVVKRKGSMVSFGNASGPVTGFALGYVAWFPSLLLSLCSKLTGVSRLSAKNVKLLRPTLFNYVSNIDEFTAASNELWDFIEKDKLNVRIHDVYPLEDVARATKVRNIRVEYADLANTDNQDIESRKTTGKLLLKPS